MSSPLETLRRFVLFFNEEIAEADTSTVPFLTRSPSAWPQDAHLGYEALHVLLDVAREEYDCDPTTALARTKLVLQRAPDVYIPDGFEHHRLCLLGRASKEQANALVALERFPEAEMAAIKAVEVFSGHDAYIVDRTAALSLQALAAHKNGRTAEARVLLKECKAMFERLREPARVLQTAMIEASIFYDVRQYEEAYRAFLALEPIAEAVGDARDRARVINNIGQCAVWLGKLDEAKVYLDRALNAFDCEGMTVDRQRVLWGGGRLSRNGGYPDKAMWSFASVRQELLAHGMIVSAAQVGLDQIEILAAGGFSEHVIALARELVEEFSAVKMPRDVGIAMAYLAEQARLAAGDALALQKPLYEVRAFLHLLHEEPGAVFRQR
jgi:tetratricopeptide (TPR) repeat protein